MQTVDLIVHAKYLLSGQDSKQILEDQALVIKDKKILAIIPSQQVAHDYQAKQAVHYQDHVVMPGLINTHTHVAMNLFRGLADDLELMDWLNNYIWPAEGKWVDGNFTYDASCLAIAEMIKSGTTCFNDMYFYMGDTAKAAEKAGIRAHLGMTIIGVPTAWANTIDEYFAKAKDFYQQYKQHDLIKPTMAPHSTYTVDIDDLAKCHTLAKEYGLKTNIHLQEAPSEVERSLSLYNKRPLQRLHEIGMVDKDLIAIHMTQLDDNDFQILQATQASIVHCPESNMKLVSGACPVEKLYQLGVNVALGTDGAASNNDLDMFGEMRSAAFLGKVTANDPKALAAAQVLNMATMNGAKALGIEQITGSLAVGKSADFIAIDMSPIETQPLYHLASQLVYCTPRSQVTDLWVAGKQLLKNRELLTLDEKELQQKAKMWRDKIKN